MTKFEALTDIALLEHCVREELNATAPRYLAVLDPLKVTITNYPAEGVPELDAVNNPEDPSAGSRKLAFTLRVYIEKSDFMLEPVKGYFRLAPAARSGSATATSSNAKRRSPMRTATSSSSNAPSTPKRAAAQLLTGARSREPSTGFPPKPRSRRKCGSTTGFSRSSSPAPTAPTS